MESIHKQSISKWMSRYVDDKKPMKMAKKMNDHNELFNRLCQCEKDDWLSLWDCFWSSFMPSYEKKYVDVKFGGKVCLEVEWGIEWLSLGAEITLELRVEMGLRWVYLGVEMGD
nr:transmembrane protein 194 [Tanacetum cinerariifolium]